jgi:hypothetical protein
MEKIGYKQLDLSRLNNKKSIVVSTKDALKDISHINWSDDVLSGKKKVILKGK